MGDTVGVMEEADHLAPAVRVHVVDRDRTRPERLDAAVPILPQNLSVEGEGAQKTGLESACPVATVDQQIGQSVSRKVAQPDVTAKTQVSPLNPGTGQQCARYFDSPVENGRGGIDHQADRR